MNPRTGKKECTKSSITGKDSLVSWFDKKRKIISTQLCFLGSSLNVSLVRNSLRLCFFFGLPMIYIKELNFIDKQTKILLQMSEMTNFKELSLSSHSDVFLNLKVFPVTIKKMKYSILCPMQLLLCHFLLFFAHFPKKMENLPNGNENSLHHRKFCVSQNV